MVAVVLDPLAPFVEGLDGAILGGGCHAPSGPRVGPPQAPLEGREAGLGELPAVDPSTRCRQVVRDGGHRRVEPPGGIAVGGVLAAVQPRVGSPDQTEDGPHLLAALAGLVHGLVGLLLLELAQCLVGLGGGDPADRGPDRLASVEGVRRHGVSSCMASVGHGGSTRTVGPGPRVSPGVPPGGGARNLLTPGTQDGLTTLTIVSCAVSVPVTCMA